MGWKNNLELIIYAIVGLTTLLLCAIPQTHITSGNSLSITAVMVMGYVGIVSAKTFNTIRVRHKNVQITATQEISVKPVKQVKEVEDDKDR